MEKYILLFRNPENAYQTMSPETMQAEVNQWNKWIGGIAAQGKLVGADALQHSGKTVNGSAHVVTDGPYIESKELIGGYLILSAESIEEAIELSKGCPVLNVEGSVEVRPIEVRR